MYTKEELLNRINEDWSKWTNKTEKKRYKTDQQFIELAIARITRGWSFLKQSSEDHQKEVEIYREYLKDWKRF